MTIASASIEIPPDGDEGPDYVLLHHRQSTLDREIRAERTVDQRPDAIRHCDTLVVECRRCVCRNGDAQRRTCPECVRVDGLREENYARQGIGRLDIRVELESTA